MFASFVLVPRFEAFNTMISFLYSFVSFRNGVVSEYFAGGRVVMDFVSVNGA